MNNIERLKYLQSMSLEDKILRTKEVIREFYFKLNGKVYISFSGGKDSTVLLDIVRQEFPNVIAVFVNTGLEYPEIVEFVNKIKNVIVLKPKMNFKQVVEKYGYPVISKEQAKRIYYAKKTTDEEKRKKYIGDKNKNTSFKISEKWLSLIDSNINISHCCCDVMKKSPIKKYEKETGCSGYIGSMASESEMRKEAWIKNGCNTFDSNRKISKPLSFWLEKDIWEYINKYNIDYSSIYDKGYKRTGCMFCAFGLHLEEEPNKFQLMKKTHPKIYNYCLNNLGLKKIISFMNKNCNCNININYRRTITEELKNAKI